VIGHVPVQRRGNFRLIHSRIRHGRHGFILDFQPLFSAGTFRMSCSGILLQAQRILGAIPDQHRAEAHQLFIEIRQRLQ
jgi:hypothetical protein